MPNSIGTWLAIGSLVISIAAIWRTGRFKILDLRTSLRKDCAAVRLSLQDLTTGIPRAIADRQRIAAMNGQSGALQAFRHEAQRDAATVTQLGRRLDAIERIGPLTGYTAIELKVVEAHGMGLQIKALQDKYARAAAEDEEQRRRRYAEIVAHVNRPT